VPDLHRLFFGLVARPESHGLAGLLWFCLPLGVVCYLMFEALMRPPLAAVLFVRSPRTAPAFRPPPFAVIGCLLVGAASHDLWDLFTHDDSPLVLRSPWLRSPVVGIGDWHLRLYELLQHASTLLGLIAVAVWLYLVIRRQASGFGRDAMQRLLPVLGLGLLGATIAGTMTLAGTLPHVDPDSVRSVLRVAKLTSAYATLGAAAALMLYCIGWQLVSRRLTAALLGTPERR
jgi:uncharacterized protein DUF4184